MRLLISALSGSLFGLGLLVSGMTDTAKVQGFLALLGPGQWNPTLAFVMGAGLIPMAIAWRVTGTPLLGPKWPDAPREIDAPLLGGAVMFGIGWGLVGLCPGPALAAFAWGNQQVVLFTIAMATGMLAVPLLRRIKR